jgi:hypothetical protein
MGRVARYKKIKACDPFSKHGIGMMSFMWGEGDNGQRPKKRSKTSEKLRRSKQPRRNKQPLADRQSKSDKNMDDYFNLPPIDQKDEFMMEDLVHSVQKQAPPVHVLNTPLDASEAKSEGFEFPDLSHTHISSGPQEPLSLDQEIRASRFLKLDVSQPSSIALKKSDSLVEGRKEGESKRAFSKRMKLEVQRALRKEKIQQSENTESKKRKKDYLNEKRQKKRKKQQQQSSEFGPTESPKREIPWNEQAERPPTFSVLPRGAVPKAKGFLNTSAESTSLNASKQHAEQRAMERMREMVQERYALLKAQRKQQK